MHTLIINSVAKETEAVSLEELLKELSLHASLVLVEHNGIALLRDEWATIALTDGDRLELMNIAAGG